MPVTRSPSRPVSGSPAYSPTNLPVYRGGSSGSAPSNKAAVVILLGQSLNAPRGSIVESTGAAGAKMPVGGTSITNWAFFASNALFVGHWDELASAVDYAEETGQTPGAGINNYLLGGRYARSYIGNVAIGARTLEVLMSAGPATNLHATVWRLCELARADGYEPEVMFYSAHGEANAAAGTSENDYYDLGIEYYNRCQLLAAQAMLDPTYVAPVVLTCPIQQSAGTDGANDRAIKTAIQRIAADLTNGIDLSPAYQWPAEADRVHPTPAGYVLRGEAIGRALRQFTDSGSASEALRIESVTYSGTTATVTFNKPIVRDDTLGVGENLNTALAEDGFEWIDNGTGIAINSVAYSGSTATLTLSSAPAGTEAQQVLRIAMQTTTATLTAGADNLSGSILRATTAGWASTYDGTYTNYEWASPQIVTDITEVV